MLNAKLELVQEFLGSLDCYSKVTGFETAIQVFSVEPNTRVLRALTLENGQTVLDVRQFCHARRTGFV